MCKRYGLRFWWRWHISSHIFNKSLFIIYIFVFITLAATLTCYLLFFFVCAAHLLVCLYLQLLQSGFDCWYNKIPFCELYYNESGTPLAFFCFLWVKIAFAQCRATFLKRYKDITVQVRSFGFVLGQRRKHDEANWAISVDWLYENSNKLQQMSSIIRFFFRRSRT